MKGGGNTLKQFIDSGLWDEARVFTCKSFFEEGVDAPELKEEALVSHEIIEGDLLQVYQHINR